MFFKSIGYCVASIWLLQIAAANATPATKAIEGRIVNGTPADIATMPYVVQLWVRGHFSCGGSLIGPKHVLTAAHCVVNVHRNDLIVIGGTSTILKAGGKSTVENIIQHPNFNLSTMNNDVAVLKLSTPLKGKNIGTIALCTQQLKADTVMTVSGWGTTSENTSKPSNELMTVNVPITERKRCVYQYKNQVPLTTTMICASQPGSKDSCSGDSGGPGVVDNKICGIVSFGVGCARKNYSGVYTNVIVVKKFIEDCMKK